MGGFGRYTTGGEKMPKRGKNYRAAAEKIDRQKLYEVKEAMDLLMAKKTEIGRAHV